jgi:H+/Cl- antiporter ClcA
MTTPSPLTHPARRLVGTTLSGIRSAPYLRKWLVLGALIGIVAGLGAVVFYDGLRLATRLLLTDVGGYRPAGTLGEGGSLTASGFSRPWAIPLVVGAGGLLSGLLVFGLAPEAEGHGTDAAIHAVHTNPKGVRLRTIPVKLVASVITIGTGGSGGREGPTAQISSGFGSVLARVLNLSPADSRICVSAGIASGIGAIFRAPLGGALLGAELLYTDDVEIEAFIPSLVATVVAYAVFGSITHNFSPIFGYHNGYPLDHIWELALFVPVGLLAGAAGKVYALVFYGLADRFGAWRVPRAVKPALAGLVVGAIGLAVPGVLGTGYGEIQRELNLHDLLTLPLWLVLLVPVGKILATGLTVGSGGSGGIFGPGMVIGGASGAALWRVLHLMGLGSHVQVAFVIVGMAACFGAVAHAPLSVTLMVAEMTGSLAMLPPAMVAVAFAVLVVGGTTIYRSQLRSRADSPAHRFGFGLPAPAAVAITRVMQPPRLVLSARTPAAQAVRLLSADGLPGAPVVNDDGAFLGTVQTDTLTAQVDGGRRGPVGRLAASEAMTLPADVGLDAALEAVPVSPGGWVTVLDDAMHVVGVVDTSDLVRGWRATMADAVRRLAGAAHGTVLSEFTVRAGSAAAGRDVTRVGLPAGAVVVSTGRGDELLFPERGQLLQDGDVVTVLVRSGEEGAAGELFEPAGS